MQVEGQWGRRREASRRKQGKRERERERERVKGSTVSPHRGWGNRLRTGQRLNSGGRRRRGRRSVVPAFAVRGCHLFTHSTMYRRQFSEQRHLHNVLTCCRYKCISFSLLFMLGVSADSSRCTTFTSYCTFCFFK